MAQRVHTGCLVIGPLLSQHEVDSHPVSRRKLTQLTLDRLVVLRRFVVEVTEEGISEHQYPLAVHGSVRILPCTDL